MDNLRGVIKNLFCYMSSQQILNANDTYKSINEEIFVRLGANYIQRYSNDELRNMYHFMQHEFQWQNRKINGVEGKINEDNINVFDTLLTFNFSVLIEENGVPLCQYIHLLRWREMITSLEEDLFVTSFLAQNDILRGVVRKNFFWKPVIGHNNYALNKMVQQGVAENHFHLKGSAPMFHLSWINMMNYPDKPEFEDLFKEYDKHKLQREMEIQKNQKTESYVTMWRQASLIRVCSYAFLQNDYLETSNTFCTVNDICRLSSGNTIKKITAYFKSRGIDFDDRIKIQDHEVSLAKIISKKDIIIIKRYIGEQWVCRLLKTPEDLDIDCGDIRRNVDRLKDLYGQEYDYMLCDKLFTTNYRHGVNEIICGERWFMYSMFTHIYGRREEISSTYINWFYAYLVIKAHIRNEIVQANMNVGFDNFMLYQDRKEQFIENTALEPIYLKMALRDTIYNQSIISLEARIAPKETVDSLIEVIKKYDEGACWGLKDQEKKDQLLSRFFYVVHFIKEADHDFYKDNEPVRCRHFSKRESVMGQALTIAKLREMGSKEAKRIRGIDACSPEIVCRPEVFAQAFRFLKNHTPKGKYRQFDFESENLMATYHVGEDFLDIVDGLRAIDEAICFLNLRCGDRLGHALALGIDVESWYQSKSNRILISKQEYMDNLVWLYSKIRKYNIVDAVDAQTYIEKRFDEYFHEVYLDNINTKEYEAIMEKAKKYYFRKGEDHGYRNIFSNFGLNEYYNAWKLRGDAPELYEAGYFVKTKCQLDAWEDYAVNKVFPQNYAIRYEPAVAFLYSTYHYNSRVRRAGSEVVEVRVLPCMIHAVNEVQMMLQKEISALGIAIETNPSSNYLISSFRRYDQHPIVTWYNNGLTYDENALKKSPQINVSINTDDQGVFATYIENEYAYLALALEKHINENGEHVYNRTLILQWLDNIRKMGISMSFGKKKED